MLGDATGVAVDCCLIKRAAAVDAGKCGVSALIAVGCYFGLFDAIAAYIAVKPRHCGWKHLVNGKL